MTILKVERHIVAISSRRFDIRKSPLVYLHLIPRGKISHYGGAAIARREAALGGLGTIAISECAKSFSGGCAAALSAARQVAAVCYRIALGRACDLFQPGR